ncbi:MAG: HAD family hydrolase [Candidatus Bathyarchaeota archaeon]|nr:MAG: HAD family hydrolase [Candidatus Bathyarchaeota archaeon]
MVIQPTAKYIILREIGVPTSLWQENESVNSISIKAVIFDLDGTIVSFNLDYKALRGEVRSYLLRVGVPASVVSANENIFDMLNKTAIYVKNIGKSLGVMNEIRNGAWAIAEKYELEAASNTDLLPGADETLKALKRMNLKIGLFTLNSDKAVNYILRRFKLGDFFGVAVPRNKVSYVKPNPGHLEMALKILGVTPEVTMVVGDSKVDMESAMELKAIAVGLPTGISTIKELTVHGANYIITSITDLPILIERVNREQATQ